MIRIQNGFAALCIVIVVASASYARPNEWTYARLAENATLIVIGRLESARTQDVDFRNDAMWKRFLDDPSLAKRIEGTVEGRIARFRVETVLKGDWKAKTIEATYLAPGKRPNVIINGPTLVELDANAETPGP